MAVYKNFILTNGGIDLLADLMNGSGGLEFRYLAVGAGSYSETEKNVGAIRVMNGLKDERKRVPFAFIEKRKDGFVGLKANVTNEGLQDGYKMTEAGIYAGKKGVEGEVLYCVSIVDNPDYMPDFSYGLYNVIFKMIISIGDVSQATIEYTQDTYALAEDLQSEVNRAIKMENIIRTEKVSVDGGDASETITNFEEADTLENLKSGKKQSENLGLLAKAVSSLIEHLADIDNPHKTDKDQIGLGKVNNTSDQEKPISTAQQNALDALYEQLTAYTNRKIADLINGAPESLDTLKEVADAIAANKTVMDALDAAIGKKANAAEFDSHTKDATKHITAAERTKWNAKMETTGDSANNTLTFTSGDAASPTGWADIGVVASGEKHSSLLRKMSLAVKNLRYLYKMIGTTDISAIGGGTLTGAINALNTGKFDQSGGTVNGRINAGGNVELWTDGEGGNVRIIGKDETVWEADALTGDLRIFTYANGVKTGIVINKNGEVTFPSGATTYWNWIQSKPSTYPPSSHRHDWSELDGVPDIGGSVKAYAGYIGYHNAIYGHALCIGIGRGVYKIHIQGTQISAGSGATFDWGFNLTGLLNVLKLSASMAYHAGKWLAWNAAGQLLTDSIGYGGGLSEKNVNGNRVLMPGRYHNASGDYGGWDSSSALGKNGTFWDVEIMVG